MAASPATAGRRLGSRWTFCASRTVALPSTGTCSRTRRPAPAPSAACRCSAPRSPPDRRRPCVTDRVAKTPGPDHPITVEPNACRVVVRLGGKVIADTTRALTLRESDYPPVQYIPREDVDMTSLKRTNHGTYCPYKGDASYFSIPAGGERSVDAIWTYEAPYDAVVEIKDHLAFYPDRVDAIEQSAA
ncbi:MAG: DUF427 domain-containing protein [Acetobacteraceae bacterium]|nr:DUF427 domain-containing protein [Acetobacteraceae bacterium]